MTSSLVGSEMCIRDSHPNHHHCRARVPLPPGPSADLTKAVLRPPFSSVSYTHLTLPTICSV
eukprot:3284777-Prorocentrum_lima.AAC.1